MKPLLADLLRLGPMNVQHGAVPPFNGGAGTAAPVGSAYLYQSGGVGAIYLKTGAGDTEWTQIVSTAINVADYGAVGDGVTDDRTAISNAVNAAIAAKTGIYFPYGVNGRYKISKYVYYNGSYRMTIYGDNATIVYPSADTNLNPDGIADTVNAARSAFLFKYCQYTTIVNLGFEGQTSIRSDPDNKGSGVYQRNSRYLHMIGCKQLYGSSSHQQDQQGNTNGTGDQIAVAAGIVTLTDSAGKFQPGHVGCNFFLSNCINPSNNGMFIVASYISATQITYANAYAVNEVSGTFDWVVEDGDFGTLIEDQTQVNCRGVNTLVSGSEVRGGTYSWPREFLDMCGIGDSLSITGTTVTLTDYLGRFKPTHGGKYIQIANATSAGNNGVFLATYVSPTVMTFQNAAGVTEDYTGNWWVMNGEKTGLGAGVGSLTVSGTTATFRIAVPSFDAGDTGKSLILRQSSQSAVINGHFAITVVDASTCTFDVTGLAVGNEDYAGVWTIDGWDSTGAAGSVTGSSHAFYIFSGNNGWSGRSHIQFNGVKFFGNRTCCIKISGSATPVRDIVVRGCQAFECCSFVTFGADDAQIHSGLTIDNNLTVDCGQIHRRGQFSTELIWILGSRGIQITDNTFHWTRESVAHQFGSTAGIYMVHAQRYVAGSSQPVEDILIDGNKFTYDAEGVAEGGNICDNAVRVQQVGRRAKYGSGTVTKSGNIMTLTSPGANFLDSTDVDDKIKNVNSAISGNNGTFTVQTVPDPTHLTYTNAIGTGGGSAIGQYRMDKRDGQNAGMVMISRNQIAVGGTGVYCTASVVPSIIENQFFYLITDVYLDQNVNPIVNRNQSVCASNNTGGGGGVKARVVCTPLNAWPAIWDNWVGTDPTGAAHTRAWNVSTDGTNNVDHPLLGRVGRLLPTFGQEEVVFAYGANLVDGDTITINNNGVNSTFTYKTTAPGANEFNDQASLMALLSALTNLVATDYGTGYAGGDVATGHVRVRRTVVSTTDGNLSFTTSTLSTGALALLYNDAGNNSNSKSRGSASAGPIPDKAVVWSPMCSTMGFAAIAPANTDARAILQAGGPAMPVKNANDSGSCEVELIGDVTGKTPEFRWYMNT